METELEPGINLAQIWFLHLQASSRVHAVGHKVNACDGQRRHFAAANGGRHHVEDVCGRYHREQTLLRGLAGFFADRSGRVGSFGLMRNQFDVVIPLRGMGEEGKGQGRVGGKYIVRRRTYIISPTELFIETVVSKESQRKTSCFLTST